MTDDKKLMIQQVIDRLLYCDENYMKELEQLNSKYNPHLKTRFQSGETKQFMFPLSEVLN